MHMQYHVHAHDRPRSEVGQTHRASDEEVLLALPLPPPTRSRTSFIDGRSCEVWGGAPGTSPTRKTLGGRQGAEVGPQRPSHSVIGFRRCRVSRMQFLVSCASLWRFEVRAEKPHAGRERGVGRRSGAWRAVDGVLRASCKDLMKHRELNLYEVVVPHRLGKPSS